MTEATLLRFATIDLERDATTCIAFARDAYVQTFGSDETFVRENGADGRGYAAWLAQRIPEFPEGHVHLWRGRSIIGQLVMRPRPDRAGAGYVNLVYLIPAERGAGAGAALQRYIVELFERNGVASVQLSVSPTNARALAYYRKHGWRSLGPDASRGGNLTMELALSGSRS